MIFVKKQGVWLAGLTMLLGCTQNGRNQELTVANPSATDNREELIVLTRKQLEAKLGPISSSDYYEVSTRQGKAVTVQFDDLDQDDIWDEAVFLYKFRANESVTLVLKKTDQPPVYKGASKAHVRMKLKDENDQFGPSVKRLDMPFQNPPTDFSKHKLPPYLTEGPGWENDKVAFRLYFDTRNNKDIYGKRVSGMVMDTVGANPANSYHNLSGWGMDILRVGSSLGAGALAFHYQKPDGKDSLVRLGGKDILGETYQQVADGPVRAIFRMDYKWTLNGKPVTVTEWMSIWGGQYFYQSKIVLSGELPANLRVDMGMADFYENKVDSLQSKKATVLYSYGKQSENHDDLGIAILSPSSTTEKLWQLGTGVIPVSDITDTYLSEQPISDNKPVTYRFYTAWSKTDKAFMQASSFVQFLKAEAENFDQPISVQIKKIK